nr:hypothetical protein [Bradyrhizobium sp. NC92]
MRNTYYARRFADPLELFAPAPEIELPQSATLPSSSFLGSFGDPGLDPRPHDDPGCLLDEFGVVRSKPALGNIEVVLQAHPHMAAC